MSIKPAQRITLPELTDTVLQVLRSQKGLPWSQKFTDILLQEEEDKVYPPSIEPSQLVLPSVELPSSWNPSRAYPQRPLYAAIAERLLYWATLGKSPVREADDTVQFSQLQDFDAKDPVTAQMEASVLACLRNLRDEWGMADHRPVHIRSALRALEVRGIQRLLFMRKTVGSCYLMNCKDELTSLKTPYETEKAALQNSSGNLYGNLSSQDDGNDEFEETNESRGKTWSSAQNPIYMVPPLNRLLSSFNALHSPNDKLSVGARALSKHSPRDETRGWWGVCTGTTPAKNAHAMTVLAKILGDATWINIHMLPHEVDVLEVRNSDSYGARWSSDGKVFRGFLEPHSKDGFVNGWHH